MGLREELADRAARLRKTSIVDAKAIFFQWVDESLLSKKKCPLRDIPTPLRGDNLKQDRSAPFIYWAGELSLPLRLSSEALRLG